jgi:hypothetical protein
LARAAAHASGCVFHHSAVLGSGAAPASVSKLISKLAISLPVASNATLPSESIEFAPGMGPSVSMSVEM